MNGIVRKIISTVAAAALALAVMTVSGAPGNVAEAATTGGCNGTHTGWEMWAGGAFTSSGSYYLNNDVTLSDQITIGSGVDVTLCLNGHTITAGTDSRIFRIDGSLTLCDCGVTGKLTGGNVTGNGGAVYMDVGSFTMNGGTISDNKATVNGGGVYLVGSGTFTMNGGTISDNTAKTKGGGVYVSSGTFNMTNGTISGNTASSGDGGGVFVNGDTFKIDGNVNISGNTKSDDSSANNVHLYSTKSITIGSNFNNASKIGVNTKTAPTCKAPVSVTGTSANDISASFTADKDGQSIVYSDGKVQVLGAHSATKTEAKDPTCTKEGNKEYWTCLSCKKYFSDSACTNEITLAETVTEKAEHTYGDWQTTTAATCKADGTKERSCTNSGCSAKETGTIPKTTTHNYVGGICSVCSAVDPDHTHTGGTATCSKKAVCTICKQEYGEPAEHNYGAWSVTKNPSETATGTAQRTCSFGEKETKTDVPALSDTSVWTKVDEEHVAPTNTTPGKDVYRSATYGRIEVVIPATGGGDNGDNRDSGNSSNSGSNSGSGSSGGSSSSGSSSSSKKPPVAEVELDGNVPETEIATPDNDLKNAILTEAEQENADGITFILRVTDVDPGADKAVIETRLGSTDGFVVGRYLDASLFKVENGRETRLTKTNTPIKIRLEIPEELRADGRTFAVIRVHNGSAAILRDLDNDSDTVTIETDKFSTYALIYSDSPTAGNPYTGASAAIFPTAILALSLMLITRKRRK